MRTIEVDAGKYVVLDVETNGFKAKEDDLLSISIYKPDDGKMYNRFLPLELAEDVYTTRINGIRKEDLERKTAITQEEFNEVMREFELDSRTILFFAGGNGFDDRFLKEYLRRKNIQGFEGFTFYNFKKQIISYRYYNNGCNYPKGIVTKDNLCILFGIPNVQKIHTGMNDCKLEWELFKKLDGHYYLITEGKNADNVYKLSSEYIIPVSYLSSHSNLRSWKKDRPYIVYDSNVIKTFEFSGEGIKKFEKNISGITIERLINTMLDVEKIDSSSFLIENKKQMKYIGQIPKSNETVSMRINSDGTAAAMREEDKKIADEINAVNEVLKKKLEPVVEYIKNKIFGDTPIKSQELVINREHNFLALCDLSNDNTVLEIKTNNEEVSEYKEQLFYEANGRKSYLLQMDWQRNENTLALEKIVLIISLVNVAIGKPPSSNWTEGRREQVRQQAMKNIQEEIKHTEMKVVDYKNSNSPIKLECKICGKEWKITYSGVKKKTPECDFCRDIVAGIIKQKGRITEEDRKLLYDLRIRTIQ